LSAESAEADALSTVLEEWHGELDRVLKEWKLENRTLSVSPEDLPVILSGGSAELPGLIEHLNRRGGLRFAPWPTAGEGDYPGGRYAVACGTAIQALGRNPQAVSLLPNEIRDFWQGHHSLNLLHSLLIFLMATVGLALGLGTWQKLELTKSKTTLLQRSDEALGKAQKAEALTRSVVDKFDELYPVLEKQQRTLDALHSLALLQSAHTNKNFWFVLFADQYSYFAFPPWNPTNQLTATNLPSTGSPNQFVTELTLPAKGEAMRQQLRQIVSQLKESALTRNVDLLAEDRRRLLVNPELLLPDQHFTIDIEPAQSLLYPILEPAEGSTNAPATLTEPTGETNNPAAPTPAEAAPSQP
jgi:hypothetical protein